MAEPTKAQLLSANEALRNALTRLTEQQTATSDILRVISGSRTDVQPVFDAIVQSAVRLLGAYSGAISRVTGDQIELAALTSTDNVGDDTVRASFPGPVQGPELHSLTLRELAPINMRDMHTDPRATEGLRAIARARGNRSVVAVPLLRHDEGLGVISVTRREPGGFTDDEIALLKTFADQAVIAIENVRLLTELQERNREVTEALEQQTATSEILRVISSSPTDVQPVFDVIVEQACRLCDAVFANAVHIDGELMHNMAAFGFTPEAAAVVRRSFPMRPSRATMSGRAILEGAVVASEDANIDDVGMTSQEILRSLGGRAMVSVPMLRDGIAVGAITLARRERGQFPERQVNLLRSFANQAVIALENVRLFTALQTSNSELRVALEQQTATSEVLKVISRSTFDLKPVLATLVENATRLAGAEGGLIEQFDGEVFRLVAEYGASPEYREYWQQNVIRPGRHSTIGRAALERRTIHIVDVLADPEWGQHQAQRMGGQRSVLGVPMLKQDDLVGVFFLWRSEVRAFTEKEIELVTTFADQAVIAIENVRLFTELQTSNRELTTALEQQTATADILRVISSSPTDEKPVFDAIAHSSVRLCEAGFSVVAIFDGEMLHLVAADQVDTEGRRALGAAYPYRPNRGQMAGRAILDRAVVHVADVMLDPEYVGAPGLGNRAMLSVPMLRKETPIGTITIGRFEPRPFTDQQIALLQTFADQAVIAIENVRLFTELQTSNRELTTALDTQTATADILRVISGSRTDVQPVFDAIVASAVRLLGAYSGTLTRVAGDQIELAALTSTDADADAIVRATYPRPIRSEGTHAQAVLDRIPLNYVDAQTDARVSDAVRGNALARGFRSLAVVPMLRHGDAVGTIMVTRREPGGFADDEIALLQTFADQAVIAIENARLLTELQQKNESLTEALERQTATAEILRVISSSPTDTQPVFDAIAANAARLCSAIDAQVLRVEGDVLRLVAAFGASSMPPLRQLTRGHLVGRAVIDRRIIHIPNYEEALAEYPESTAPRYSVQSALAVPLLREGVAVGVIRISRTEMRPFTDNQIALLQTFADQAVIAIENVRLFTELQTSNRELTTALDTQTATSDILRVISRSQTDVQPVFDAIVTSAARLLGAYSGSLTRIAGDQIALAAFTSIDDAADAALTALYPRSLHSEGLHARVIRDRAPLNIADAQTDPRGLEAGRAYARVRGYRSVVVVPLIRHDEAVGAIAVTRRAPGGFTDDEIALLKTFADQAVIAIENARLLSELQARTAELTQSVEEMRALGEVGQAVSSTLDLDTVLTTIVSRAVELSGGDGGSIYEYDEAAEEFTFRAGHNLDDPGIELRREIRLTKGEGATGHLAVTRAPVQLPDISTEGAYDSRLRGALLRLGTRAVLAVPLLREEHLIGGLVVSRNTPGEFPPEIVHLLQTFATQSALAIQNARLFREIEIKSRELEVASQHKSEFLASMSHELRTPLNAIIGFSDVLLQGMFGDTNEKQTEYLRDILASGQHLLSLINDILDLSKIEAGRMELDVAAFDLPTAIDDAMLLMRERAGRRGITLERHVGEGLGEIRADQRKVKQVLLNLLSNAVKFTPEGGRIDVRAGLANGTAEISVTDTGIGIAPEDHDAVFEEFRQVGKADKKAEGTGLGLALCRKFVELHGGRIWVKSQIGQGSTFTFTLPLSQ